MENKIFKIAIKISTIGVVLLGEFIVFMVNYGLMPKNTILVILETIGVLIAAYGFYVAGTSFYDYCDEVKAEMEDKEK